MSPWLALALVIILVGAFAILSRLHLLAIAVTFWIAFAAGIAVIAVSGHQMTARWHLGPITGFEFWRVVVLSPEVMIFLFFMITDPKTTPGGRVGRRVYALSVALVSVLLIAPQTTEFWTKVALLGALWLVCASRPVIEALSPRLRPSLALPTRYRLGAVALAGVAAFAGVLVLAGIPARPDAAVASATPAQVGGLPRVTVLPSKGVATQIDPGRLHSGWPPTSSPTCGSSRTHSDVAKGARRGGYAGQAAAGPVAADQQRRRTGDHRAAATVDGLQLQLEPAVGQDPPIVVATATGTERLVTMAGTPAAIAFRGNTTPFTRTLELQLDGGRYLIAGSRGGTPEAVAPGTSAQLASSGLGGTRLQDVAQQVGIDFRQRGFLPPAANDASTMMGGGVCWIDFDNDGWLDLFAVNSYAYGDVPYWERHGGLPGSGLFHNASGKFTDVSRASGANVRIRGNGCVAADLNGDGFSDLYVTSTTYDALLWNDGKGHFSEGARAAGIAAYGWHSGATVGDVNGDRRPDLFVAGYADLNFPLSSASGFPNTYAGVSDQLFLNAGNDRHGHAVFREVGEKLGIDSGKSEHGLGAVFTDVNNDGRLDLYVANDANPNRLYLNVAWPGGAKADPLGLGFRLKEEARRAGIADPNAGMGIAAADYSGDGRPDLLVTNSHKQLHGVFRSEPAAGSTPSFSDARSDIGPAFDTSLAGWGASWVDLDNDTNLDLALANGAIPVTGLGKSAEPVQVFENLTGHDHPGEFAAATDTVGLDAAPLVNGRGLAAADFDNDGNVDLAVNTIGGKLMLLRNTGANGNWLEVKLGRFAPGALVTAVLPDGRRLVQEIHAGSSYLSSEDPRAHFGLGRTAKLGELIARYPGGHETRLTGVGANQVLAVGR